MSIAVIAGAYVGTHIRYRVAEKTYRQILKWLLTLLAIRIILITFI